MSDWAILGGCDISPEAVPTTEQVNRGRLVAAIIDLEQQEAR